MFKVYFTSNNDNDHIQEILIIMFEFIKVLKHGGNDNGSYSDSSIFYSGNGNTYHVLNSNRKDIVNIFH